MAAKQTKKVANRLLTTMPQSHLDICDRFRLARMEQKLTQSEWADKLDLTLSYVKCIETRVFTPNIYAIKQLHKMYGYPYDWIMDGTGKK